MENRTKRNVTGVSVDFRASDAAGNLITQTITQTTTLVDILRPGQRSPVAFHIPFPGGLPAFQAASKSFTLLPNWSYTELDSEEGLEVGWGSPWQPPTPYPTLPTPPYIYGWVKNNGASPASGVSVVLIIRGNEQVRGLVLEATSAPIYGTLYPGKVGTFYANFSRDYGSLFGSVEAVAQRRLDIPGILGATSW